MLTLVLPCEQSEPVDHMPAIREECKEKDHHVKHLHHEYTACLERVKKAGSGTCEPHYLDFLHAVDHCVRPPTYCSVFTYRFSPPLPLALQSAHKIFKGLK